MWCDCVVSAGACSRFERIVPTCTSALGCLYSSGCVYDTVPLVLHMRVSLSTGDLGPRSSELCDFGGYRAGLGTWGWGLGPSEAAVVLFGILLFVDFRS